MKVKKILLFLFIILVLASGFFLWRIAPIANGYAAKYLCSLTYNSHLDPEKGMTLDIQPMHPLFKGVKYELDTLKREVTTRYFGLFRPRTAIWREGCGCTLLVSSSADQLRTQHHIPNLLDKANESDPNKLWPDGSMVNRDSLHAEINWQTIDQSLDRAMKETQQDPSQRANTLALVIAWKGQIVGERYAEGVDANTSILGWSVTKSITNALTGVMVKDHQLDIRQPIGFTQWKNDVRKDITIDHLLRMESGLDFEEDYQPLADATEMLYACNDMGEFAAAHKAKVKPDQRWCYSSGSSNILADVLFDHLQNDPEKMHHLAYDEFFNKLGITTAVFEHDESNAFVGSSYLSMSARDWLRVCLLYMQDGVWKDERILPEGWVHYSLTPTPNATDACYGAHIWLNAASDPAKRKLPGLPPDTFMFRGFQGQWVVGIPSKDIMLVRLGVTHQEDGWSPEEILVSMIRTLDVN